MCWKTSGEVPDGWIMMSIADVKRNQAKCRGTLGDWDIVALQDGTIDGKGYGYKYHQGDSRRCTIGTKLLMEDDGRSDISMGCGDVCYKKSGDIPYGYIVMSIADV